MFDVNSKKGSEKKDFTDVTNKFNPQYYMLNEIVRRNLKGDFVGCKQFTKIAPQNADSEVLQKDHICKAEKELELIFFLKKDHTFHSIITPDPCGLRPRNVDHYPISF